MERIEILPLIRREMKRNHVSQTELAHKLNVIPTSVQGMLRRPTLQVQKLAELSEALNYNFFLEIGASLSCAAPTDDTKATLLERIKALEMEVSILRQTLKDVVSR